MTVPCKRCSKPAAVRAQVISPTSGRVLMDSPLCTDHEQAERATVAMQGGLTEVVLLPLADLAVEPAPTKLIYLLSTGHGGDYGTHAATLYGDEAYEIAKRWNAERPEGESEFYVERVPLIDLASAGRNPLR